jgi:tRNA G18 (ribose-2'-O)-methylase SpoU
MDAHDGCSSSSDPELQIHERESSMTPDSKNRLKEKGPLVDGKAIREEKRRKWEAKRQKREDQGTLEGSARKVWLQNHSHFACEVSMTDVDKIVESSELLAPERDNNALSSSASRMPHDLTIHLLPYFNIQETQRTRPPGSSSSSSLETLFIAEGTETIRILIQQQSKPSKSCATSIGTTRQELGGPLSCVQLKSIFVKPNLLFDPPVSLITDVNRAMDDKVRTNSAKDGHPLPGSPSPGFHVLVGTEPVLSKVAGYAISRGALACGVVPTDRTEEWLNAYLARLLIGSTHTTSRETARSTKKPVRLLALDGVCDNSNLGTMIRTASAFGMDAVVLSHDTCDAWYRRAIRVSMGHIFVKPVVRVQNLAAFLAKWGQLNREAGPGAVTITSYAAVIDRSEDVLVLDKLARGDVPSAWCCVMGNEGKGISGEVIKNCTKRIRIDMAHGVDSLSVPIACGILLHGLREREQEFDRNVQENR